VDAIERLGAHCDDDTLALLALGEPAADPRDEEHLRTCALCQASLDQLRAVVATARSTRPEDVPVAPPPTIWEGVARAMREDREPVAAPASLADHRQRRGLSRRTLVTAGAAAAAVAAALVVAVPALRPGSDEVVTQVALSPVGSATTPADAVMVAGGSGARMTVDASNLPRPVDGYYEVWLMGENNELVSLGVLDERKQGSFRVPDGVDPSRYPYVDVSLEPLDGNPAHSGDSLVRGRVSA